MVRGQSGKSRERSYMESKLKAKRSGGAAQVVGHLLNKRNALSSIPSTT
jgi:hypothetical protein